MKVGGLVEFVMTVLAIAACATLLLSFVGAAFGVRHGAQPGDTSMFKVAAVLIGTFGGVFVAAIVGLMVLSVPSDGMVGLMACLAVAPITGCAVSYGIARAT